MPTASRAKHKFCRRVGQCIWGDATCPSVKRPYAAGPHGKGRRVKLSTYGELLMEKQKLKNYYAISEKQLQIAYAKAKAGMGQAHEKLFRSLEQRLDAMVYRAGFAPTIFAAKQFVNHGHILVDGNVVDRPSYRVKPGQTIQVKAKSQTMVPFQIAAEGVHRDVLPAVPGYLDVNLPSLKATLTRKPEAEEIPVQVNIQYVVEFYSR